MAFCRIDTDEVDEVKEVFADGFDVVRLAVSLVDSESTANAWNPGRRSGHVSSVSTIDSESPAHAKSAWAGTRTYTGKIRVRPKVRSARDSDLRLDLGANVRLPNPLETQV